MAVSPRLGACPDTGVWARHDIDPTAGLAPLAVRMIHMHLKGYHRGDDRDCAPGADDIGLDGFLRAARDAGYGGVYSLEYEADHNSDAELTRARRWVIETLSR
ncbi:MAG: TIM barrel protein, partial [Chloroflexota bacterium]